MIELEIVTGLLSSLWIIKITVKRNGEFKVICRECLIKPAYSVNFENILPADYGIVNIIVE